MTLELRDLKRHLRIAFAHERARAFSSSYAYHSGLRLRAPSTEAVCTSVAAAGADSYYVELVMSDGYHFIEKVERVDRLDVVFANSLGTGKIPSRGPGYFVLPCEWKAMGEGHQ